MRGTLHKSAEHKEKPANPDISRVYELLRSGAGGGTRTHTPLRITDFESVSSANSDTPAYQYQTTLVILALKKGFVKGDMQKSQNIRKQRLLFTANRSRT